MVHLHPAASAREDLERRDLLQEQAGVEEVRFVDRRREEDRNGVGSCSLEQCQGGFQLGVQMASERRFEIRETDDEVDDDDRRAATEAHPACEAFRPVVIEHRCPGSSFFGSVRLICRHQLDDPLAGDADGFPLATPPAIVSTFFYVQKPLIFSRSACADQYHLGNVAD